MARRRRKFFENVIQLSPTETNMIWIMLAPQLMEENGRPPLEISPPLIYQMLAPRPPFLPLAPPKIRGGGAFYDILSIFNFENFY